DDDKDNTGQMEQLGPVHVDLLFRDSARVVIRRRCAGGDIRCARTSRLARHARAPRRLRSSEVLTRGNKGGRALDDPLIASQALAWEIEEAVAEGAQAAAHAGT